MNKLMIKRIMKIIVKRAIFFNNKSKNRFNSISKQFLIFLKRFFVSKSFFIKNSFYCFVFFLFFFSCKPKIKDKDDETKSYNATFYLTIDNRDEKKEQDKEQKKYSFSLEEGSKFSKEQLEKLQQDFLDKNSTGYTFNGWYSDEKLATEKITADSLAEMEMNENKNFYGKILINQYTVTFNTRTGASAVDSVKVNHGRKVAKPDDPTKAGFNFANWYKEDSFQNVFSFSTETITASITLYALFGKSPTDITLSANSIDENKSLGSVIGNFSTTDATTGDTFIYSLVAGEGADNNADFTIDGNALKTAKVLDFETKNSYKIRIRTTDKTGLTFEKKFTIAINDLVELTYSYRNGVNTLYETPNDGTIAGKMDISINGDNFITPATTTGFDGNIRKFIKNIHYTVANVPADLTEQVTKNTETGLATIQFTGKATAHAKADSQNNVTLTFLAAALQKTTDLSAVPTKSKNDIKISFDVYLVFYTQNDDRKGRTFTERNSPVGRFSVSDTKDVFSIYFDENEGKVFKFSKNTIANPVLGTHFSVNGLPNNLGLRILRSTDKTIIFAISGVADSHANSDDTSFTVTIDKSMFATPPTSNDEIIGRTQTFKLDFKD